MRRDQFRIRTRRPSKWLRSLSCRWRFCRRLWKALIRLRIPANTCHGNAAPVSPRSFSRNRDPLHNRRDSEPRIHDDDPPASSIRVSKIDDNSPPPRPAALLRSTIFQIADGSASSTPVSRQSVSVSAKAAPQTSARHSFSAWSRWASPGFWSGPHATSRAGFSWSANSTGVKPPRAECGRFWL